MARNGRVGLVLSGGGAKGAYQIGVVEYLADVDIHLTAIAGASIGALNGTVLAGATSMREGANLLMAVWRQVADHVGSRPVREFTELPDPILADQLSDDAQPGLADVIRHLSSPVLAPGFLEGLVREYVVPERVRAGLPIWVSVFPSLDLQSVAPGWLVDVLDSKLGGVAEWIRLNDLPTHEMQRAVMASAALPALLPPQVVGGRSYRDGGLADNTPAGALVHEKCNFAIVVQLTSGVVWDRRTHPTLNVLEIRPSQPLANPGLAGYVTGLLDFSQERVEHLRRQGYEDARETFDRLGKVIDSAHGPRVAQSFMLDAVEDLDKP